MGGRSRWALSCLLAIAGCSGPAGPGDGGLADPDGGTGVQAPAPPAPAMLTPCPTGWREVTAEARTTVCEPWPEGGRLDCGPGQAHLPGQPACAPVGRACPAGDTPDPLPADRSILHVTADSIGGDGTVGAPMVLRDAMTRATTGTVVAVAKGTYDQVLLLPAGVTVQGACAAETVLRSTLASASDAVVTPRGDGTELRDFTLAESPRLGVIVRGSATIHLAGIVIEGAQAMGILVLGGTVTANGLVVRDSRSRADRTFGRALTVQEPGTASVRRALLERNRDFAVGVLGAGGSVTLEETVVRDTQSLELDYTNGGALVVGDAATAQVRTSVFEHNRFATVASLDEGSLVDLEDVVIRDTRPTELTGELGRGVLAQLGGSVEGRRLLLERNREVGFYLRSGPASLEDTVVRETLAEESGADYGHGVSVSYAASLTARRLALEGNHKSGIFVGDGDATADIEDLIIRDTVGVPEAPTVSSGLMIVDGASVNLSRGVLERNAQVGISSGGAPMTMVTMTDVEVTETRSHVMTGRVGRGMHIQGEVDATMLRVALSQNHGASVAVAGGASLRLEEASIHETLERPCTALGTCGDGAFGALAYLDGQLTMDRFLVDGSPLCGILVGEGGTVDLSQGEIRNHPIGACVQVEGYDVDRLTREVRYLDNGTNLETTELPLPESDVLLPDGSM